MAKPKNRVEFDLTRKPYGRHQEPAVIPSRRMEKAEQMTDEQFDALYEAIKGELGAAWCKEGSPLWVQERQEKAT